MHAVDLVREQKLSEDRAGSEPEIVNAFVVNGRSGDVRRHEVGRKLDAVELAQPSTRPSVRTSRVFPSPGTLSIRTWPSASNAARTPWTRFA